MMEDEMLQKILNTLNQSYTQSFNDIKLHRDMIGYVCVVSDCENKYILKLFRSKHTKQAQQSIEIMTYLYQAGYPTAHIIPTASNMPYFILEFQDENRIGVLYEYINGIEIDKNRDIVNIGRQTAKLHNLMREYPTNLCYHDKSFFIDRYIHVLSEMNYPQLDKFKEFGNMLWQRVNGLPNGFCHGDYHTGNMILDNYGQFVLFDFDTAANAFSVYDIAVICDMTDYFTFSEQKFDETTHMLERFMKGYNEYNSISKEELDRIYDFIAIRHFEVQATIIENLGLSCVDNTFIDEQLTWLMQWEKQCYTRIK